jgi:recombinational DNA repair ATPase RecF
MVAPRAVAVVGFKAAGKTRVVEALVSELTRRGYRVGTLKHTADDQPLDKAGTDTWRHAEAGAVSSAILSDKRTAIFLKHAMNLHRTADALGEIDEFVGDKSTVKLVTVDEDFIDIVVGKRRRWISKETEKKESEEPEKGKGCSCDRES